MFYAVGEPFVESSVGPRTQDVAFRIGFAMVLMLMVFATWNDIEVRFWARNVGLKRKSGCRRGVISYC